jgi:alginate O-acetyltransferase complex protein AlgI
MKIWNYHHLQPQVALAASAEGAAISNAIVSPELAKIQDTREAKTAPDLPRFLALALQLAGLMLVFSLFNLEAPGFVRRVLAVAFGAFLVHYWLPFRFKEPFWVAVSVAAAFPLLGVEASSVLIGGGLVIFAILRAPFAMRGKLALLAILFGALMYGRATGALNLPGAFFPVFGAIFMFRLVIYLYDLSHSRQTAQLVPFLSYFFILPNYVFTLFPVIDFQTMRRGYYQRDAHTIAQQGIQWMTRGTIQLILYRAIVYFNDAFLPDQVTSFGKLAATIVLTYLLYMNVSGHFHLIVGMLHLFGYDLPETNRRYLLASSISDFWRRANIYWKDFMVKLVYFPVYFKLRKKGDLRAQIWATFAVVVVTWALHVYQSFWLIGKWTVSWPDSIFWIILGLLMMANLLYERRHKRRVLRASWSARAVRVLQTMGTFALIATLWTMWSSPGLSAWIYLMTHWTHSK